MSKLKEVTDAVCSGTMSLQDASKSIDDFAMLLKKRLEDNLMETRERIKVSSQELSAAISQGDLSENAEYTAAINTLKSARIEESKLIQQLEAMDIDTTVDNYSNIGLVVLYTTVLLTDTYGTSFVVKLYPKNISDVENCIIDVQSRIGAGIYLKKKGDKVSVKHKGTGKTIEYVIKDFY